MGYERVCHTQDYHKHYWYLYFDIMISDIKRDSGIATVVDLQLQDSATAQQTVESINSIPYELFVINDTGTRYVVQQSIYIYIYILPYKHMFFTAHHDRLSTLLARHYPQLNILAVA